MNPYCCQGRESAHVQGHQPASILDGLTAVEDEQTQEQFSSLGNRQFELLPFSILATQQSLMQWWWH